MLYQEKSGKPAVINFWRCIPVYSSLKFSTHFHPKNNRYKFIWVLWKIMVDFTAI
jgi:hypothetical protein